MPKHILSVGAGLVQVAGIQRAQEMGFTVVATDGSEHAPGLMLADIPVVMDIKDVEGTIALCKQYDVQGAFSIAVEAAVRTVARVAEAMKLPGLSAEAAQNATDKRRMRELWTERGVPSPAYRTCNSIADAEEAWLSLAQNNSSVVVKPADSSGSRGVSAVQRREDLSPAYAAATRNSTSGTVLLEEFMAGMEISVEAFAYNGVIYTIALSDKIRTQPPYLLDTSVLFPSVQPDEVQQQAIELVADAARALGIDMAPIHAEVMLTPHGPMMVELAARGPGFKVFTDMIPWTSGVDVVRELIRVCAGQTPNFTRSHNRGSVLHFPSVAPGVVVCLDGIDAARRVKGVHDLEIYTKLGDEVRPLTSGIDRIGHVISMAATRTEAEAVVHQVEGLMRLETVPENPSG